MRRLFSKRLLILARTSLPGTAFTAPDRNSARRRFATAIHSTSISASVGFMVFSSESMTMTLSSTGRDSASSVIHPRQSRGLAVCWPLKRAPLANGKRKTVIIPARLARIHFTMLCEKHNPATVKLRESPGRAGGIPKG
jgi:hypothetical protein